MPTTTQPSLPGFDYLASFERRSRPATNNITADFRWERVDYLLTLPSTDFGERGLSAECNRKEKRDDPDYEELRDSIAEEGFYDPIFVYRPDEGASDIRSEELGNGHHRLVAAYDLGFTHVPVTSDDAVQWDTSYPGHPDYMGEDFG